MKTEEFKGLTENKIVVLDGATGTEFSKRGMPVSVCPELWALENIEKVQEVGREYAAAGADILYAPTFGGNRLKLENYGLQKRTVEINRKIASAYKEAAGKALVFGDISPTGLFVEPYGDLPFEKAVEVYREQAKALADGGVDGFVIETMIDIQETRAALIGIKEVCDLPVIVSMTFEKDGRTLNGTDPGTAVVILQSLGASAVGCNCSTGPRDMLDVIRAMAPFAKVPLMAKPNAGMPKLVDGQTVFEMPPEEFGSFGGAFTDAGVNLMGGCCGTTPDHIASLKKNLSGLGPVSREAMEGKALSSSRKTVVVSRNSRTTVISSLQGNDVLEKAGEEVSRGADCFLLEGADSADTITALSAKFDTPLSFTGGDINMLRRNLRLNPGRGALLIDIKDDDETVKLLCETKKWGAIPLLNITDDSYFRGNIEENLSDIAALGERGGFGPHEIVLSVGAPSGEECLSGALAMISAAVHSGIDVMIMTGAMEEDEVMEGTFLTMAAGRGALLAKIDMKKDLLVNMVKACDGLTGRDRKLLRYIEHFSGASGTESKAKIKISPGELVFECVLQGNEEKIESLVKNALEKDYAPQQLVDEFLVPAINEVGDKFDKKEYFLPQLIMSADTMSRAFEVLEPLLQEESAGREAGPSIVLATVKGDIHDIGKNIVALMLKNYGFTVIDLGKDVPAETILDEAQKAGAGVVGLSALMTTTMVEMKEVIILSREKGMDSLKFMIGGAVTDRAYAEEIGAHGHAADAMEAVRLAGELTGFTR